MQMITTVKPEKLAPKHKLNLLQVFRGLASLLVVLAHGSLIFKEVLNRDFLFNIFDFGGSGVDFFFVLSGFIISYVHRQDIGHPSRIKGFLLKRFVRIYPIYWFVLTLKLLSTSSPVNNNHHGFWEVIKAYLLFPQDRILLSSSFLGVSWTLSYEIFFYLAFSLLICLKPRFYIPMIAVWLSAILLNFLGILHLPLDGVVLQFLFSILHLEFAMGFLAAYLVSKYRFSHSSYLLYFGLFIYTLSAINTFYHLLPISYAIAYGIPSAIIILGGASLEMSKAVITPQFLLLLGNASYSIYLIHGFVINNLTKIAIQLKIIEFFTQNNLLFSIFAIINAGVAVAAGCIIYHYVEKPLLGVSRRMLLGKA
jgi:exopolysaccharide production protein ExoZ